MDAVFGQVISNMAQIYKAHEQAEANIGTMDMLIQNIKALQRNLEHMDQGDRDKAENSIGRIYTHLKIIHEFQIDFFKRQRKTLLGIKVGFVLQLAKASDDQKKIDSFRYDINQLGNVLLRNVRFNKPTRTPPVRVNSDKDILERAKRDNDIPTLVRLLSSGNVEVQWWAPNTLGILALTRISMCIMVGK
jgi:hypothetical protein